MGSTGTVDPIAGASHRGSTRYQSKRAGLVITIVAMMSVFATVVAGCTPTSGSSDPGGTDPGFVSPISTDQRFFGVVNGRSHAAVVHTDCNADRPIAPNLHNDARPSDRISPTPAGRAARGFAIAGQTVSVRLDANGPGNTGDNGAVYVLPNTNAQFVPLRNWNETVEFPTDVEVPCEGSGTIVFDPCFGFAGCRGDAGRHVVEVTFVPSGTQP